MIPGPESFGALLNYKSSNFTLVTATQTPALAARGNRTGLSLSIAATAGITATRCTYVGYVDGGTFYALAGVSQGTPSVFLSVRDFGVVIRGPLVLLSSEVAANPVTITEYFPSSDSRD